MTNKDKQDVIAVCNILADKMSDSGKVAVQQIIGAVEDMVENEPCEDAISRKDVIILIDEATELHPYKVIGDSETYSNYNQGWEDACNWLYAHVESDNLKTVTPQPKVGKWKVFEYEHFFDYNKTESKILMCSECDTQFLSNREQFIEWANYNIHYCPNCGCRMKGEGE